MADSGTRAGARRVEAKGKRRCPAGLMLLQSRAFSPQAEVGFRNQVLVELLEGWKDCMWACSYCENLQLQKCSLELTVPDFNT